EGGVSVALPLHESGSSVSGDRGMARQVPHRAPALGARLPHPEGVCRDVSGLSRTETRGTLQVGKIRLVAGLRFRGCRGDRSRRLDGQMRNYHRSVDELPPGEAERAVSKRAVSRRFVAPSTTVTRRAWVHIAVNVIIITTREEFYHRYLCAQIAKRHRVV